MAAELDEDKEDLEEAKEDVEDAKADGQDPAAVLSRVYLSRFLCGYLPYSCIFPGWQVEDQGLLGLTEGLMLPEAIKKYEVRNMKTPVHLCYCRCLCAKKLR